MTLVLKRLPLLADAAARRQGAPQASLAGGRPADQEFLRAGAASDQRQNARFALPAPTIDREVLADCPEWPCGRRLSRFAGELPMPRPERARPAAANQAPAG